MDVATSLTPTHCNTASISLLAFSLTLSLGSHTLPFSATSASSVPLSSTTSHDPLPPNSSSLSIISRISISTQLISGCLSLICEMTVALKSREVRLVKPWAWRAGVRVELPQPSSRMRGMGGWPMCGRRWEESSVQFLNQSYVVVAPCRVVSCVCVVVSLGKVWLSALPSTYLLLIALIPVLARLKVVQRGNVHG